MPRKRMVTQNQEIAMANPLTVEKGGAGFEEIKLLLCENPLSPIEEAIEAVENALPRSNYYTEPYSEPLRTLLSGQLEVSEVFRQVLHIDCR